MAFDREALISVCTAHGVVTRIVVAKVRGSAPREVGAAMLVWPGGQNGTIGGGTLEFQATTAALANGHPGARKFSHHALGPDMGQCCGGAVDLLSETYDLDHALALPNDVVIRGIGPEPLAVARIRTAARGAGIIPLPQLIAGWMIEPVHTKTTHLWIWGAGHVGRAMVDVLDPLPDLEISWIDTHTDRFPTAIPDGVTKLTAPQPEALVSYAPADALHLIVTYSHALDMELCHRLLGHGFAFAGLIGSNTKWARFRKRLTALGHNAAQIQRITCPIGTPELGKHPHVIALGAATQIMGHLHQKKTALEHRA